MTKKIIFFISFLLALCVLSSSALADSIQPLTHVGKLPIQQWATDQGTQVFFARSSELPMVDIRLIFPAGSAADESKFGVSNLTNAALMTGTKTLNTDQIATEFDQLGVLLAQSITQDYAVIGLRSLTAPQSLDPAVKLLAQILLSKSFPAKQVSRLQKQTLSAIQANQQAPRSVANDLFFKSLYGSNGYGHPILGTTATVNALTRDDLVSFYEQHYTANTARIVLVGNITETQAKIIAEQLSKALPAKHATLAAATLAPAVPNSHCQQFDFPSGQANILIGGVGITRNDPDFFPLIVGNHILGGGALTSWLFKEVRDKKGLAYSVHSGFMPLKEKGPFLIELQSRNEKASEALQTVHETLSKFIKKGPTDEELAAAKRNLIGKFYVNLSSNSAITKALSNLAFYQLPLNYFDNYTMNIKNVTAEQVRQAVQRHLHPDQFVTVIVGKAACPKSN